MNRISKFILAAAVFAVSVLTASATQPPAGSPVDKYGRLFADGNKIVGLKSDGAAVQLKGPSFYWSHSKWSGRHFFITDAVDAMIDGWNAQVIRFPLGINENPADRDDGGYDTDKEANWERLKLVVDHAVSRGVYVIIDWHAHNAHTPANTALAIDFFTNPELAGKYGDNPAVIFEIYNEPLGVASTWATEVKPYSDAVIGAIREAGFDNLILVGNPYWTAAPHLAIGNPPVDPSNNFAMVFHFYSNTHFINENLWFNIPANTTYRAMLESVLNAGLPLFVSEWGTNDASDQGSYNFAEADRWHAFFDEHKISSCAWSAAVTGTVLDFWNGWSNPLNFDKANGAFTLANWTNPDNMTPHGRYIYRLLTGKDTTVTQSADGWPAFTGLRSPIPLVQSGNWNEDKSNPATTINWKVEDGVLNVTFELDSANAGLIYAPYAGVGLAGNVSHCEWGIGYTYKGSKHTLRPEQNDINAVTGWDYHFNSKPVNYAEDWTTVRIPWSFFQQDGWGAVKVQQDRTKVTLLRWYVGYLEASHKDNGEFWVRDVWCLGDENGVMSARPSANRTSFSASPLVKISGRNLQLRLPNDGRVDIYSISGKRVNTIKLKQGGHNIRVNNLPAGTYIVNVTAGISAKQSVRMVIK